jgi:hypothetical protein
VVAVELKKALAVGEANSAAVLQEKIDAPIAVESIDDKADAGDDLDDKEDIKDILSHNFLNLMHFMLGAKYRNAKGILLYSMLELWQICWMVSKK